MKKTDLLSRAHLETLSFAQLVTLADEYGIDIPDDLNRQFIIGDLIQLGEELCELKNQKENLALSSEQDFETENFLPQSYNETKINVLLRNPASLFIWWDLNENVLKKLQEFCGTLVLAIYFFESESDEKPSDAFSIQVSLEERERYVIIPAAKKFVRVDLIAKFEGKNDLLSFSQRVPLPCVPQMMLLKPGEKLDIPFAMELSGATQLLHEHYNEYRQSFC